MKMVSILVVDDDVQFRDLLASHLESAGYNLVLAGDGKEAFTRYTGSKPDIVVCDIRLPKEDGLEFLLRVRGWDEHQAKGIILMSGKDNTGSQNYREIVKNLGAADFLQKPFSLKLLEEKINNLL